MDKSISLARRAPRLVRFIFGSVLACSILAAVAPAARGDTAAGRAAYEKGDYARAMSEWQPAADRGDAAAQFGLGSLYELGAGDLKQDYKRADYWYQLAAAQGYAEAQYRLALIWAAGNDEFSADLAEAYKWVTLAADSKGVWGSLAADLKGQLDRVISAAQQSEGRRRAAAWTEAHKPHEERPVAVAAPPASPATPPAKPGATGCPGWPFPTLPCTEQFPALPGLRPNATTGPPPTPPVVSPPPALAQKSPLQELEDALTQIDCASLRSASSAQGAAVVSGTVPSAADKAKLVQLASRFFPNTKPEIKVEVIPPPLCQSLAEFTAMRTAGLISEAGLGFRLGNGTTQLHEGDPMMLEVRSPAYEVNLRIDYFSIGGEVLHLWPTGDEPTPRMAAETMRVFGDAANGKVIRAGGPPFGTELITLLATRAPVELGSRPPVERASDYLRELKRALARISPVAGKPNAFAELLVKTGP